MEASLERRCSRAALRTLAAAAIVTVAQLSGDPTAARAKKADLTSTWRGDVTIAIDGVNQEWEGRLVPVNSSRASIGFYNDTDHLYFCLTTGDPALRWLILRRGLIVWLDQGGGKKKSFGVEFPVGMEGTLVIERRGETGEPVVSERPLAADTERIVILGPGKHDREYLRINEAKSIRAKVREEGAVLVYEMSVPLGKGESQPYGIGAAPGAIVGVGLETPEFKPPAGRPVGVGPGGPGGRWGGMGGGGSGGRGGDVGRGRVDPSLERMLKPLKQWTSVQLAAARAQQ